MVEGCALAGRSSVSALRERRSFILRFSARKPISLAYRLNEGANFLGIFFARLRLHPRNHIHSPRTKQPDGLAYIFRRKPTGNDELEIEALAHQPDIRGHFFPFKWLPGSAAQVRPSIVEQNSSIGTGEAPT